MDIVECPGKITIEAGKRSFVGPEVQSYPLPVMPKGDFTPSHRFPFSL